MCAICGGTTDILWGGHSYVGVPQIYCGEATLVCGGATDILWGGHSYGGVPQIYCGKATRMGGCHRYIVGRPHSYVWVPQRCFCLEGLTIAWLYDTFFYYPLMTKKVWGGSVRVVGGTPRHFLLVPFEWVYHKQIWRKKFYLRRARF